MSSWFKPVVHKPNTAWKKPSKTTTIAQVGQVQLLVQITQDRALYTRCVKGWGHCGGQHGAPLACWIKAGEHCRDLHLQCFPALCCCHLEGVKNRAAQRQQPFSVADVINREVCGKLKGRLSVENISDQYLKCGNTEKVSDQIWGVISDGLPGCIC